MANLQLGLLGRPFLNLNNAPLPKAISAKALGLVYYLAVTGQAHSREELAGLLWSDLDEGRARRNLRVELAKIRPHLNEHLYIQRRSVALDRESDFDLDVATFSTNLNRPEPSLAQIETAVSLYRGDFLEDFSLRGAVLFEEWVLVQRERLRQMAMDGLYKLSQGYEVSGNMEKGITAVRRLLALEPWLEEGHRQLMILLAKSGQRAAALAQYDTCTAVLSAELGVMPAPETDKLYDRVEAGEFDPRQGDVESQSPNLPISQPSNLPIPFQPLPQTDHFVGRDDEIEALRLQLTAPDGPHIVALVGMGGVGKSTLANQIAHALRDDFADGVLWADAKASEPLDILESWGQAYGYDFSGLSDVKNRAAAVRGMLADKNVLLVLDDVVRVARIRPLIPNGAGCAILLTTRDLDVASALDAEEILLGELSPENGVALLTSILGEKRVKAESEAAAEICALLHNLPLAVEITAQRLKSRRRRRLADMARRLAAMEQRLGLEISDRAVRASFEVSWGALDATLQQILGLLGVFQGRPFAAPALAHIADLDAYETEDHLFSLTALSLLAEEGDIHFRQHPLLADFAQEKLGASGNDRIAYEQMATYYHSFAAAHQTDYAALQPEWPNLMAGMRTAHEQENWPLVLNYAHTLSDPWFTRARFSEMRQGMAWAEKAAALSKNKNALGEVLLKWGEVCIEQNNYDEAHTLLTKSLTSFSDLQEQQQIARVKYQLARIALEKNEHEKALEYLETAFQISQSLDDDYLLGATYYRKARVWTNYGPNYEKAQIFAKKALTLQKKINDKLGQITTLRLLSEIAVTTNSYENAEKFCKEAYQLSKEIGNLGELAASLYLFIFIYRVEENYIQSIEVANQCLDYANKMGNLRLQGLIYLELSRTYKKTENYKEALAASFKCLEFFERLEYHLAGIYALSQQGDIYEALNNKPMAYQAWEAGKKLATQIGHKSLQERLRQRLTELNFT
ncbi:MAG: BTAD domain-containing putative transcriptional regulator [Chloroflexota bacterium]